LTEEKEEWNWSRECASAVEEIKRKLTSAPLLAYYDMKKEVTIHCDEGPINAEVN